MSTAWYPTVDLGPFRVANLSADDVVHKIVDAARGGPYDRAWLAFALHVGGLNSDHRSDFLAAMSDADLVYADGGSVVALGRLAGARQIERAPTTDVGWTVLSSLSEQLGRRARVALIGGPPGLADRAGETIESSTFAVPVFATHGYHRAWEPVLATAAGEEPDVTFVGMGAPLEMVWCADWRDELPRGVVVTCGGWFGHIAGDEKRAPGILRRPGVEWIARVAQSPRRLAPRYAAGILSTARYATRILAERSGRHRGPSAG